MTTRMQEQPDAAPGRAPSAGEDEAAVLPTFGPSAPERHPDTEVAASMEPSIVDLASDLSFPASDAPCWTLGRESATPGPGPAHQQLTSNTEPQERGGPDHLEVDEEQEDELMAVPRGQG